MSNNKLFYRAIGIVQTFAKCNDSVATTSLLRAIYGLDDVNTTVSVPYSAANGEFPIITSAVLDLNRCHLVPYW